MLDRKAVEDHPRLRGEYLYLAIVLLLFPWITPAYAGSTKVDIHSKGYIRDHPRLRGEYTKKSLILRDPCLLV